MEKENIYKKINQVKKNILNLKLKKSGKNKYANFEYFELGDIIPSIINNCKDIGLFTCFSFNDDIATLKIINVDNPNEVVEYTSPMADLEIKGANGAQVLGGLETYQRRYLYLIAFDIVEPDTFDAIMSNDKNTERKEAPDFSTFYKTMLLKKYGDNNNQVVAEMLLKFQKSNTEKQKELYNRLKQDLEYMKKAEVGAIDELDTIDIINNK